MITLLIERLFMWAARGAGIYLIYYAARTDNVGLGIGVGFLLILSFIYSAVVWKDA